jgi:DNA-binding CsgD family transcriptional regulator
MPCHVGDMGNSYMHLAPWLKLHLQPTATGEAGGLALRSARFHEQLWAPFEAAPQPYLLLSPILKIVEANRPSIVTSQTKRNEILGCNIFDVFPDNPVAPEADGISRLSASFGRVLDKGLPDDMPAMRYDIRDRDGRFETRWWKVVNIPVFDEGHLVSILHHPLDVTARERQINAAMALWAALSQRERDVLSGFSKGLNTKQVAAELGISAKTVELYRLRLFERCGVNTLGALVRIGVLATL